MVRCIYGGLYTRRGGFRFPFPSVLNRKPVDDAIARLLCHNLPALRIRSVVCMWNRGGSFIARLEFDGVGFVFKSEDRRHGMGQSIYGTVKWVNLGNQFECSEW